MKDLQDYSLEAVGQRLEAESEAEHFRAAIGEAFDAYDGEPNYSRIANLMESMHLPVSAKSMLTAFGILSSRGMLKRLDVEEDPAPEKAEAAEKPAQPRDEKGRFAGADPEKEFADFYERSNTAAIRSRARTDAAFGKWLGAQIRTNTAAVELPLSEPVKIPVLPAPPPVELRDFAKRYHAMSSADVKRELRNGDFVRKMDEAARVGLI